MYIHYTCHIEKIHLSEYTNSFTFKRLITIYNIYFYTTFFLMQYLFIRKIFQISSLKNIRINRFIIKFINTICRLLSIFNFANCFLVHKSSSKLVNILIYKPVFFVTISYRSFSQVDTSQSIFDSQKQSQLTLIQFQIFMRNNTI